MQITIKSTRIIKEGFQSNGTTPYKWCSVMADDGSEKGTEYTTFDKSVLDLGPGSVINIGDPEIKGGKLKFKEVVNVITSVAAVAPALKSNGGSSTPDMSKEEWEEKQRIERDNIETQTAFKGVVAMVIPFFADTTGKEIPGPLLKVYEEALAWASKHLTGNQLQDQLSRMPSIGEKPAVVNAPVVFKNVGEFLTAMQAKGLSRNQVIDELIRLKMIKAEADLPKLDLLVAWEALGDAIKPEDLPWE